MASNHHVVLLPCSLDDSFELLLSRAIDLTKDESNQVSILYCRGELNKCCILNPLSLKSICHSCIYVTEKAISNFCLQDHATGINIRSDAGKKPYLEQPYSTSRVCQDSSALSISTTVSSIYRTSFSYFRQKGSINFLFKLLLRNIKQQAPIYSSVICDALEAFLLCNNKITDVNIYNGRYYPFMQIKDLCVAKKLDFSIIEFCGNRRSEMWISKNTLPHSLSEQRYRLDAALANPRLKESDGYSFFINKRDGIPTTDVSYGPVKSKPFIVPEGISDIIAIFLSSPDEFIAFGDEWLTPYSLDPASFVTELRRSLPSNYLICVRFHPNQEKDKTGSSQHQMRLLCALEGCYVVLPSSPISSYSILDQSSFSITFGSTIGLEATFWNKPSIDAGIQLWSHLSDVIYTVSNPDEAIYLIKNKVPPKSRKLASRIGAYLMSPTEKNITCFSRHPIHSYSLCSGVSYLPIKRATVGFFLNKVIGIIFAGKHIFGKKI